MNGYRNNGAAYRDFKRDLGNVNGIVTDIDKTAVPGRVAEHVGKEYLKRERAAGHSGNYWAGVRGGLVAVAKTRFFGEAAGLTHFVNTLAGTGCADRDTTYTLCHDYVRDRTLRGFTDMLMYFYHQFGLSVNILTAGMDVAATAAVDVYGDIVLINDARGNRTQWRPPQKYEGATRVKPADLLAGIDITIRDGRTKKAAALEMTHQNGRGPYPLLVIGDGDDDRFMMLDTTLSLASPLAKPAVREVATMSVPPLEDGGYERFLEELRKA